MDAVHFLQEMIRIDSSNPPGNEHEVAKLLAERCEKTGIPYTISRVESNRSNFRIKLNGEGKGKLLFCGHMDTVQPGEQPWKHSPFSGELEGDRLYGRGASDMKSGLCAMFLAIESLYKEQKQLPKDIIFLATAGEEVDSCGARQYLKEDSLDDVEAIVIGEPTNEKIVVGHKGALWLEIILSGKTAHGAMPESGINAVEWMRPVMEMVESLKSKWKISSVPLGESSLAITKLNGGVQTNVIPDRSSMHVDIRSIPPQSHDELLTEINQNLHEIFSAIDAPDFHINKLLDRPSILTEKASTIITTASRLKGQDSVYGVSYYTDGAVLNPDSKIPTLIYGPGDERFAHQPNEYVDVHAYLRSIDFYKELAIRFSSVSTNMIEK
ncbi:acetylornithine deacetylase [Virgibacillus profundi]|uniref:Probable succinyl-diaminopimelate desuccinylase n=1 Tax=Virgibacillus profundi TaxID=2024555 RepID=A0A2A2ICL3_9BACI|nr:M20 family metallopeptidase [Virgibacillus profundi]PAV29751.1 acetylornithine deacetylase [Virgibacillus profundi]PXY53923.1 acetylornithine deacetylase [Virgibacillus profundi]